MLPALRVSNLSKYNDSFFTMSKDDYISYVVDQGVSYAAPIVKDWAAKRYRGAVQGGLDLLDTKINSFVDTFNNYDPRTKSYKDLRNFGPPYQGNMRSQFDKAGYSVDSELTQSTNASRATSASKTVNGQTSSVSMSDGVTCPAMFNPGRGAELGLVNKLIDAPIKFKTGELAGPAGPRNPLEHQLVLYKPLKVTQAFAWKGVVVQQPYSQPTLVNRGYVHNIFRHHNYAAFGAAPSDLYGANSTVGAWNKTLGPDCALSRQVPIQTSTAAAALTTAGLNNNLQTPYRTPANGERMYSRVTQQYLENVGWAANPFKYIQPALGQGGSLIASSVPVYENAGSAHATYVTSMPQQQPVTPSLVSSTGSQLFSPYYYRSQFGKGKIAYDFSNDGTGPIVIDVVIHKIKQGEFWDSAGVGSLSGNGTALEDAYKNGYLRMAAGVNTTTAPIGLYGQEPLDTDPLTNSRVQFMPKACLKYCKNVSSGQATGHTEMPFKQVARDQFIISAGATRAWTFELPALDYDARRYCNSTNANSIDRVVVQDICSDLTYIVSIAYSAVATPVFESAVTGTAQAVIDRRPGDCAVSVTGQYSELCHPVYLSKDSLSHVYINSALDVPYYSGTAPTGMSHNEIANLNQVVRSQTPGSAYISVGAISTLSGA